MHSQNQIVSSPAKISNFHRLVPAFLLVLLLFCIPVAALAQWAAIGPNGGGAHLIASDNGTPGTIIAGTRNALLYRSTDKAKTWQPISFDRSLSATLNALVTDPCASQSFYIGTTDSDSARAGIFQLTQGENSWTVSSILSGQSVMSLAISGSDCRVMAAGTTSGVLISRDSGNTWKTASPSGDMEAQPIVSLAFAPDTTGTIYAGTPRLPWKTTDGGQTWNPIHVGIYDDSDIFSISVDEHRILIGACSGIYRSEDGGIRWQKILGIPGESRRTYSVRTDPYNRDVVYAGTSNGLWKSVNGGGTWVQKSAYPVRSVAMTPHQARGVILASDIGIWKSDDGADTLSPANSGFVNHTVGAFLDLGNTLLASAVYEVGSGTLFTTQDGGEDWTARSGAALFGEHIFHLARSWTSIFAAGTGHIFRSSNEGQTWTQLPWTPDGIVTDMAAVSGTQAVLLATSSKLYMSKDQGQQWHEVLLPSTISRIETLKTSANGNAWGILSNGKLFLSGDKGLNWRPLTVAEDKGPVYDFALRSEKEIVAGTLRGLLYTNDAGGKWNGPEHGLHPGTVSSVLWHPVQRQWMFCVQNGIPWKSIDGGASWDAMSPSDFGDEDIAQLYWASDYTKLYAVGFARGVFVRNVAAPVEIFQRSAIFP